MTIQFHMYVIGIDAALPREPALRVNVTSDEGINGGFAGYSSFLS